MKVGIVGAHQNSHKLRAPSPSVARKLAAGEVSGSTIVDLKARSGALRSGASATALARDTTALIAESNLAAVRSHGVDVERLLALLT